MKKKLFLTSLIITLFFLNTSFILAKTTSDVVKDEVKIQNKISEKETLRNTKQASAAALKEDAKLTKAKERAYKLIENRIASLNKLLTRIQEDKKILSEDKTSLTNDVQKTIDSLNQLKTKINADTTLTDVQRDTKKIITDYKVYLIFEPKIRLLVVIGNLQALVNKMTTLTAQIQTILDNQKSQGKDVSPIQTNLTSVNNSLATISAKLTEDKSKITAITINTKDPKTVFTQVRKDLANIRAEFAKIRNDIAQIRNDIKKLFKSSPTPTAKISP